MKTKIIQNTKTIILALILTLCVGYVSASSTWVGPTANPTGGNTDTPLNVGSSIQNKAGPLTLGSTLGVTGATLLNSNLWIKATGLANGLIVENGNVGIGTTNPGQKLDVLGNANFGGVSNPYIVIKDSGYSTNWLLQAYQDKVGLGNGWPKSLIVDNAGNVGIGTTTPTTALEVNGTIKSGTTSNPTWGNLIVGSANTNTVYAYGSMCVGNPNGDCSGATGGTVIKNTGIQFPDGSLQTTAYNTQVFTSSGTWVKAPGVKTVLVTICGGGAAGGSSSDSGGSPSRTLKGGNGGGAGTCFIRYPYSVTGNVAITVGAGGVGSSGGDSSFGSLVAPGGVGGGGTPGSSMGCTAGTGSFNCTGSGAGGAGSVGPLGGIVGTNGVSPVGFGIGGYGGSAGVPITTGPNVTTSSGGNGTSGIVIVEPI